MSNRLFVVDSNLAVQKLVEYSLSREGFEVTVFGDGLSALDALDEVKPELFIVEYNMAGIDISRFCEKIRKDADLKDSPILMLVNTSDIYDESRLRSAGVADFIKKPLESIDLSTKAKRYFRTEKDEGEVEVGEEETVKMEELLGWSSPRGTTSLFSELRDEKEPGLLDNNEMVEEKEEVTIEANKEAEDFVFVDEVEEVEELEKEPAEGESVPEREPVPQSETVAEKALPKAENISDYVGQIPSDLVEKMIKEAAREMVEKIAWEVIPPLVEIAIKKEMEKIKGEDN